MTMGVAREFADRGIRCLSISPGPIDTAFQAASDTSFGLDHVRLVHHHQQAVVARPFDQSALHGELRVGSRWSLRRRR